MNPLETYLSELQAIRATGAAVRETSYYGPLANLLNAVGATLKPKVRCVVNIQNQGAGIPDGGLFTQEQLQKTDSELLTGGLPARGVIEVKGTGDEVAAIAAGKQVAKYWQKYRQVLVTNYRDFTLVTQDAEGNPSIVETYRLAESEAAFWQGAANPAQFAAVQGDRFLEYLKRVMLRPAALTAPADVAWFLASYAREAKGRIEDTDLPALTVLQRELEKSLGLEFTGERGERFFRSTLIQTLFYGVFSAWVLWSKRHPLNSPERFDWRNAAWELHVPMIRALFEQIVMPSKLGPLGLVEVLDWTGEALNRVDRAAFFEKFEEAQAVQYFYEPFLQAFDPELRKELGVWYTPPEIVKYMVARVDTVLKEELHVADGLADPNVVILDPCCGTGAFLVEVLHHIHAQTGGDALAGQDVKQAAMQRVFGFELLPAPFVVAHLQMGLLLQRMGAPLVGKTDERVGVYLTNALTGWEPLQDPKTQLALNLPELQAERDAANHIKQDARILVIIGNPPYNGFAGVAVQEERELSNAYRTTLNAPAPQGQGLNDLYVRFYRMAERRIVEKSGRGIVCYISNYSWLDGLSFPGMRERYLEAFDTIKIDCLNGDKYKTGKVTPEGKPDPSIFSTEFNREGIQGGTAIALMTRHEPHTQTESVGFRQFWGQTKRANLLASLTTSAEDQYVPLVPSLPLGLPFTHVTTGAAYLEWALLPSLFPVSFPGIKTSRDQALVDIDRERLENRMKQYFDPAVSHEQMKRIAFVLMEDASRFSAVPTRDLLLKRGLLTSNFVRYCYRPFDVRWLYWEPETKLLDEKRPEHFYQAYSGNVFLAAVQQNRKDYDPPLFVSNLSSLHVIERGANLFPLLIRPHGQMSLLEDAAQEPRPNLSDAAFDYLKRLKTDDATESLFYHTLAVLHAPRYREENAGALRQDWPRVPLPDNKPVLLASAALGKQIAALLDSEQGVVGVTQGAIRLEVQVVGSIARTGGGSLNVQAGELAITANWGYAGQGGVTMPGRGKTVERDYSEAERAALGEGTALLGDGVYDVYLNNVAYWQGVPAHVWNYTLGGYQVLKKWLSYREQPLLGRALTVQEAREFTHIARRIAAILLLEPALDANYATVQAAAYDWNAAI